MLVRYAVDDPRYAEFVLGAPPRLPLDRHASRDGPVDVGEVGGLDVTIRHATSREYADFFGHRLFDVDRNAAASAPSADKGLKLAAIEVCSILLRPTTRSVRSRSHVFWCSRPGSQ